MSYEIINGIFLKFFRGIFPEKYHYFSRNFRKNSEGNFREFLNSHPYVIVLLMFSMFFKILLFKGLFFFNFVW